MDEFVEGVIVTATEIYSYMGYFKDLTIGNFLHAYDTLDGKAIPIDHNNNI